MMWLLVDQYGEKVMARAKTPRMAVVAVTGRSHVEKMYIDRKDGSIAHVGYVAAGRWFDVWECQKWERPA